MINKYISAVSANYIFFVINTIFFLAITPISLKVMGEAFFGLWSILYAIVLVSNVGTLGIASIVNKFASEAHPEQNAADYFSQVLTGGALIVLPMAGLVAAVLGLGSKLIASSLGLEPSRQEQFSSALALVALSLLPQFLAKVPQGFLLSQLKNRTARLIETASVISLWLGVVGLVALLGRDLRLVGAWCLVVSSISLGVYALAASRVTPIYVRLNRGIVRKMLNFSGFMLVETSAIALFQHLDKLIVGFTLGPALAGVYAVGTSIGLRMSMVIGPVTEVLIPYASLRDSLQEYERLRTIYRKVSRYVSLIVAGAGGLAIIWMQDFLSIWISPAYAAQNSQAFRLLICAYALLSLCRPAHQSLTGMGKVRFTSLIYAAATSLMLVSLYFLSSSFGLTGAVLANFVMAILLVFNLQMYRLSGYTRPFQSFIYDLYWGLFMPGLSFFTATNYPSLLVKLTITAIIVILLTVVFIKDVWLYISRSDFPSRIKYGETEMFIRLEKYKPGKH